MRPPFRSVSFPSLRQWGALLPPKKAKRLQRDCTSLRPSCWPLHLVGKCSLAPLARPWLGRLAPLASLRLSLAPLVLGSGFACLGYAPTARLTGVRPPLRSSARSARSFLRFTPKKSGIFEKKERSKRTHIFPENGIFGFCSASAPQKQDLQKSTLHNTQLWCIFYPSAFGYGKCPITCVMYKPLRLWLRGSTFLQKLRPIDRLCRRSLVLRLVAPTARLCRRATSAPTLRPTAFPGVRSPLSRLRPTALSSVRPPTGSASGRFTAPPPPAFGGASLSASP